MRAQFARVQISTMNMHAIDRQRSDITTESVLLVAALVAMLSVVASLIFGTEGLIFGPLSLIMFWLVESKAPISWILRMHRALPVPPNHPAARLFAGLVSRADVGQQVDLYYSPSESFNAYTIGHSRASAIVVNAPVFRHFTDEELAGILAHELSHVVNHDTRFMTIAASLATLISQMSFILIVVCVMTLPLAFAQGHVFAYLAMVAIALFLPSIAVFLQAKLSQAREFAADLGATQLLGSPDFLISALLKLERYSGAFMLPWIRRTRQYFGSHPDTLERVQRLESYGSHQGGAGYRHTLWR